MPITVHSGKSGFTQHHFLYSRKSGAGFTLIETLLYIALFTIMIGGGLLAAYQIISSADSLSAKSMLAEDANFIIRKIEWALSGALSIGASGSTALITYPDSTTIEFTLDSGNIMLERDSSGTPLQLNSQGGMVTALDFVETPAAGSKPASLEAVLTLSLQGKTMTATSTKFLR